MNPRPALTIISPQDLQRVMGEAHPVSDEQWPAVSGPLAPTVVVAGAGSGKTSLMKARVVFLVATGQVRPDEVLGLTFTTKAAGELRLRIRDALSRAGLLDGGDDEERLEPTVSTYNAYAAALLSEHGLRIGHEPDTRLLADATRFQLAGRVVARHRGEVRRLTESPRHVITYLLGLEGALSEHLRSTDDIRAWQRDERQLFEAALATERAKADLQKALDKLEEREELLALVDDYRALKRRLGVMDFSDQIALAAELAHGYPDVGRLERAKFKVVLLDEYQDTSVAQARLLGALFSGPDPESGRGHAVTAVGDPYQAIYGWRGASASNILRIGHTFPTREGSTDIDQHSLTVSWRCDQRILSVANRIAGPLAASAGGAAVVDELRSSPLAGAGVVRVSRHESQEHELAWLPGAVLEAVAGIRERRGLSSGGFGEVGVLTRDNATAALVFDALSAADIPVEIVGLAGLLRLPEVAEVVATLTLLHDLNANAALLTLLSGPRWAIGPRDLALLGRRARELAGGGSGRQPEADLHAELQAAVGGADPAELLSLSDALDDPGELPYSQSARDRFALLSSELRMLRRRASEPLLDLVRLVVDTCGIDLELASSTSRSAPARRDNLDLFIKAVADFQSLDSDSSIGSLLAYLTAEDEFGAGLDIATPTESDSVKLLTVHRAKGLEWDSVFVVGVCEHKFPSGVSRSTWVTGSSVIPGPLRGDRDDLPQLSQHSRLGIADYKKSTRDHDLLEERRLAYVAFTRARHLLSVSCHWRLHRGAMVGGSDFHTEVADAAAGWGAHSEVWAPEPDAAAAAAPLSPVPWPVTERSAEALRRIEGAELVRSVDPAADDPELDLTQASVVHAWDSAIEQLLAEAALQSSDVIEVSLPSSLSATSLARLRDDPEAFARDLARPMPRPPAPAARFGTRFHDWVEARFDQQSLLDDAEIPGRADAGIDDDADLREVVARFEAGPFAERVPQAVEAPFALVLDGQVIRGRIDAVYAEPDGGFLVVDWKTNRDESADPLQLAIYRLAWAELTHTPLDQIRAAFHYVRSGRTVEPAGLAGRDELVSLVRAGGLPDPP
jgi:DNA helicase-2/ATP-dependent DNA helicase PcrA